MVEMGSKEGASLSEEGHCGGPRGRAPLLGTLGYEWKALETCISLCRSSTGQPGVGSSTGDFEIWLKGALEVGRLSLWEGNLEGGLPCWVPYRMGRQGYGDGHLFPYGRRWGTLKGTHLPGTLRDG